MSDNRYYRFQSDFGEVNITIPAKFTEQDCDDLEQYFKVLADAVAQDGGGGKEG